MALWLAWSPSSSIPAHVRLGHFVPGCLHLSYVTDKTGCLRISWHLLMSAADAGADADDATAAAAAACARDLGPKRIVSVLVKRVWKPSFLDVGRR